VHINSFVRFYVSCLTNAVHLSKAWRCTFNLYQMTTRETSFQFYRRRTRTEPNRTWTLRSHNWNRTWT